MIDTFTFTFTFTFVIILSQNNLFEKLNQGPIIYTSHDRQTGRPGMMLVETSRGLRMRDIKARCNSVITNISQYSLYFKEEDQVQPACLVLYFVSL